MKLKNIEKKNTFWYQYGAKNKYAVLNIAEFLLGLVCIVVCLKSLQYLHDEGMIIWFVITIYILYAIVVLYKTIIFYVHQQYLPLTKEELSKNNITTREDYNIFLKKYLNNFEPAIKIKEIIYFNTFRYLYTPEQQLEYMKRRYIDLPESVEELIKKIMDYDLDYDVHKNDEFVTSLVCDNRGHYKINELNGFYFDGYYYVNSFDLFMIITVFLPVFIYGFWFFTPLFTYAVISLVALYGFFMELYD